MRNRFRVAAILISLIFDLFVPNISFSVAPAGTDYAYSKDASTSDNKIFINSDHDENIEDKIILYQR